MKTTKILTSIGAMSLIFFMGTSTIANSNTTNSNDGLKTGVKSQMSTINSEMGDSFSTAFSQDEFNHLRFDVSKYSRDTEETEFTETLNDQLRFDVNKYMDASCSDISELPVSNEFNYLRFDVTRFATENAESIIELPVE